ncbi:zinc/manganese transport system ATP-binding protein [Rhodococcus sp. SMB37]|uniref:zinc ABC transporter ATP-binding protein AztA n=1 Tax=Rhodococcus sp. SMB37 TaxID=2512213 RepID=UPI000A6DD3D0|nr:zinc ABC transporter ATP-binding protein AztA [Rhodococcus sp. SMB37]TCN47294.1 zinc/manganese transport system ATP-binding protein [Rhodococcus sp. SMB37]
MNTSTSALTARSLSYAYDGRDVLHDVSVTLPRGTVTAIAGPNGSGKSTFVELLAGVRTPRCGEISRCGAVALVVQRPSVPDTLPVTVFDVVTMGTWARRLGRRSTRNVVAEAIEKVDLIGFEKQPLAALSGGQRQRALLAQGIVQEAPILLLDEPAAGLDSASRRRTREILAEYATRWGAAVACVTHDDESIAAADRVLRLESGRVVVT